MRAPFRESYSVLRRGGMGKAAPGMAMAFVALELEIRGAGQI
ncbi:MAG TPA: hypothetical protein VKE91_16795 [Blastocatellia bacterium]|nr:hypothetical protein [Blastocatellia bacterium]